MELYNMPQFTTMSPTHVAGKKEYAWQKFLKGRCVAIGWLEDTDLTGKSIEQIEMLLEDVYPDKPDSVIHAASVVQRFLNLEKGDYVAIPNVNFGPLVWESLGPVTNSRRTFMILVQ